MYAPGGSRRGASRDAQAIVNDARKRSPGAHSGVRRRGRARRSSRSSARSRRSRRAAGTKSCAYGIGRRRSVSVERAPAGRDARTRRSGRARSGRRTCGRRSARARPAAGVRTPVGMMRSSTSTCSHAGQRSSQSRRGAPGSRRYGCQQNEIGTAARPVGSTSVVMPQPALVEARRRRSTTVRERERARAGRGRRRSRTARAGGPASSCAISNGAPRRLPWIGRPLGSIGRSRPRRSTCLPADAVAPSGRAGCPTGARAGSRSSLPARNSRERARPRDVLLAAVPQRRARASRTRAGTSRRSSPACSVTAGSPFHDVQVDGVTIELTGSACRRSSRRSPSP